MAFDHADSSDGIFEERAEHLTKDELLGWTAEFPKDAAIQRKLTGTGAKLLIGPRGSGKSTHLKRAFYSLLESRAAFPVYVNYSKSLALEPLFHKNANALALFRQWVTMKIVVAAHGTFVESGGQAPDELGRISEEADAFISRLERGDEPELPSSGMGPTKLAAHLARWSNCFDAKRCVLLLDDAAHAFSPEQQREFFEVFRELRSRHVSPKAAVYPGITEYSPYFNVGHEGELVEVWADVNEHSHVLAMREIVSRRMPAEYADRLDKNPDVLNALVYASFGLPRSFLNMVADVLGIDEGDSGETVTWARARPAILSTAEETRGVLTSLSGKLKRFRPFIDSANDFGEAAARYLKDFNEGRSIKRKAVSIGLRTPIGSELEKVLGFLEYAGLVRRAAGDVSRGVKGSYRLYTLHYALLISRNSLSVGKRVTVGGTVEALQHRHAHAFPKIQGSTLLGEGYESRCVLDLPACHECHAERTSPDAKFCANCGAELTDTSIYDAAMDCPVDLLPITDAKKAGLHNSGLRTVKHIVLAEPSQIRAIRGVGEIWAARIKTAAEEFISV